MVRSHCGPTPSLAESRSTAIPTLWLIFSKYRSYCNAQPAAPTTRTATHKVAAVQFGCGEIDQNLHALPALGRAGIADCCGEHLACMAVIADPEEDAAGSGGQLRGAVVVKRRRGGTAARLVKGGLRAVERTAGCGVVPPDRRGWWPR